MLFKTLKRQIEKYGLTEELKQKIDIFYLGGRLTKKEYEELMGINDIPVEVVESEESLDEEITEPVEEIEVPEPVEESESEEVTE